MNDSDSSDNNLKKIQEKIKSKRSGRAGLSWEARHAALIWRRDEPKNAKASAILMRVYGGLLLAGTLYLWYSTDDLNPIGGWGMITGLIIAGIFKAIYPDGIDRNNKVHRYGFLIFGGGILFLMYTHSVADFTLMLLPSIISFFFLFGSVKDLSYQKPQT